MGEAACAAAAADVRSAFRFYNGNQIQFCLRHEGSTNSNYHVACHKTKNTTHVFEFQKIA
jgi:hypothetical protein